MCFGRKHVGQALREDAVEILEMFQSVIKGVSIMAFEGSRERL